ncbi:RNA polymerase sigma factor [Paenarthrobacter sp. RAF54_2]|uniref:RNA polymerase sigma factor n=1 Tax=Paenarthrobacter sp. RAF54_2 TaxID=3233061 RepID=UPI003F948824
MTGESDISDEVLWRRVVAGDGDAFGVIFDRHHDRIRRYALRVLSLPHVADDVAAMVFYEAWRKRYQVRITGDSILPWLLVTANNTVRNHVRQQRRYRHFLSQLPTPESAPDIAESIAEADDVRFWSSALREAFGQLKRPERDVLTLCVIERIGIREAAIALDVAEGTVKSRLHRAKTRLGNLFSETVCELEQPDAQKTLGRSPSS